MKKYLSPIFLLLLLTSCKTIENSSDTCSQTTYHDSELSRRNIELLNQQRRDEAAQRQRNEEERRRLQAQQTRTRLEAERLRLETARQRQIIVEREEDFRRRQREYEQARLENERRQRAMEQAVEQRRRQNVLNAQECARPEVINQAPVNQEERDLQQAMQNSLITAREEERSRVQVPQNAIVLQPQQNQQIAPIPQDNSNYRDNDYRLAGNITMDLARSYGRQPTREELITTWKTRIGITQAQAERIYTDMFG